MRLNLRTERGWRMKLSIRWNIVPGPTLADKLTFLEAHGYDHIDLSGPALEIPPGELGALFRKRPVQVETVDLLNSVLNVDEKSRQERMARNHEILDLATNLGATGALVHPIFAQPQSREWTNYLGLTPPGTPGNPFRGSPAEVEAV